MLKKLPKAELHSHLGGVLSPEEIIEVAKTERNYKADSGYKRSKEFRQLIDQILLYENNPSGFEQKIYGQYSDDKNFFAIGIDAYQKLGDYQGSSLFPI